MVNFNPRITYIGSKWWERAKKSEFLVHLDHFSKYLTYIWELLKICLNETKTQISLLPRHTKLSPRSLPSFWAKLGYSPYSALINMYHFFSGRRIRPGVVVFTAMAIYGVSQKANADLGGELWGQTPPNYFEKDR